MRAVVPFPELAIDSPVVACCYCAPEDLGGFIDVTAHDAHMINMQSGRVALTLRREDNSYFWEIVGVEPLRKSRWIDHARADSRV